MAEIKSVSTFRARRVRDRILEVAARCLAERGFEGTSLQDICDEVGIRKASLFHHFRSKEQLRQSVIDNLIANWNTSLVRRTGEYARGEDRYGVLTRELVRFLEAEPDRARLIVREALDRPEDAQELLATLVRSWMGETGYAMTQSQGPGTSGFPPPEETPDIAHMLLFVVGAIGLSNRKVTDPPQGARAERRSRYIDEVIRAGRVSLFDLHPEPVASGA